MSKLKKKLIIVLFALFSSNANATFLPVLDYFDIPQDILNAIETAYTTIETTVQTAYQATIQNEQIQTAIQTYNTAVRTLDVYNQAVRHYDAITGNPGWGTIMNALGSRELRNYAPGKFNDLIGQADGLHNKIWGSYGRLSAAAGRFQTGNRLYLPSNVFANKDTLWASPNSSAEAQEMYEESFNLNKAYSALAETSYDQVEEHIDETNRLIDKIDSASLQKEKDDLRNAFLGDISVNINEGNRMSSAILKRLSDTETDRMRQVAIDKQAYNQPLVAF
jgi:hypothetical protein